MKPANYTCDRCGSATNVSTHRRKAFRLCLECKADLERAVVNWVEEKLLLDDFAAAEERHEREGRFNNTDI